MVLQDEHTNCHVSRICVIAPEASHAIEETVVDQAVDAATDPAVQAQYEAALRRYFADRPTPSSAFEQASRCLPCPSSLPDCPANLLSLEETTRGIRTDRRSAIAEYGWFRRDEKLQIDIVDPDAAIVVWLGPDTSFRTSGYQILSYDNRLWWPLGGDYGRTCHFENYVHMLGRGNRSAGLAASFVCAMHQSYAPDPIPAEFAVVDNDPVNSLADCLAFAHQSASEIILGNGVF